MLPIQDDPIVKSIIERGYPPWVKDDGYDNDWEEEDGDVYYGNDTPDF